MGGGSPETGKASGRAEHRESDRWSLTVRPWPDPDSPTTIAECARVIGYASVPQRGDAGKHEIERQAKLISRESAERGLELVELMREVEPANGKALGRPGLTYALRRIASGEAAGLIVAELSRLTHSAADLGRVIEWLGHLDARLVAVAHSLDTAGGDGRLAAELLVEVSRWERSRLRERTRTGLQAARRNGRRTGRAAVSDYPQLRERIVQMREQGMALQAMSEIPRDLLAYDG